MLENINQKYSLIIIEKFIKIYIFNDIKNKNMWIY